MRFEFQRIRRHFSIWLQIGLAMAVWLVLISALHYRLNGERSDRRIVTMGYMPVITNLSAPILDFASREGNGIRFKALKFAAFAEMAEALRNDRIQAAFMIAPLSVVLHQQGEAVRIVYVGNRHESTLVVRKDLGIETLEDLSGRTIAVPMRFSGHCLSLLQVMDTVHMDRPVNIVEMNPPDMAAAMAVGSLDGYYVGEPFASLSVKNGDAEVLHYVEDLWEGFICNLLLVKQSTIDTDAAAVRQLVQGAARAGIWARENPREAANIAALYWNQPSALVEYALTTPADRIVYDRYVPEIGEIQQIADLMQRYGLITAGDISGLVENRFARRCSLDGLAGVDTILRH